MGEILITPVILAGGSGKRLWPLSRADQPKQVLKLLHEHSLLQDTARRLNDPAHFHPPVVLCGDAIRFVAAEQLQGIRHRMVLEPLGRNTAPAIAVAARMLHAQDPQALMLVTPADLAIGNTPAFLSTVRQGVEAAMRGKIITFGMQPDSPHTGYGYIHRGEAIGEDIFHVASFTEKPDAVTAARYLASGEYYWNSGMFLMSAAACLAAFERHCPEVLHHASLALEHARPDLDFLRLDAGHFSACTSISIDYAVMERSANVAVVPADVGWNDLGTWDAVWRMAEKDERGNALNGNVVLQDSEGSYVRSDGGLIACTGLKDMVIVSTSDATLVAPREKLPELKRLTEELKAMNSPESSGRTSVSRPWGNYAALVSQPGFQVKRILVKPGGKLSLQSHRERSEHWVVVQGTARVTCGEKVFTLGANESTFIPVGTRHRLENAGADDLEIIEVQVGAYLSEDDIVRHDDIYQRHLTPKEPA